MGLKLDGSNSKIEGLTDGYEYKSVENSGTITLAKDGEIEVETTISDSSSVINSIECNWSGQTNASSNIQGSHIFTTWSNGTAITVDSMRIRILSVTNSTVKIKFYKEVSRGYKITCTVKINYTIPVSYNNSIELQNDTKIEGNLTCNGFSVQTLSKDSSIGTLNKSLTIDKVSSTISIRELASDITITMAKEAKIDIPDIDVSKLKQIPVSDSGSGYRYVKIINKNDLIPGRFYMAYIETEHSNETWNISTCEIFMCPLDYSYYQNETSGTYMWLSYISSTPIWRLARLQGYSLARLIIGGSTDTNGKTFDSGFRSSSTNYYKLMMERDNLSNYQFTKCYVFELPFSISNKVLSSSSSISLATEEMIMRP